MKVGDLVRAPHLMDHDGSVGIVIRIECDAAEVLFTSGSRYVFPHLLELLEVIDESR
tara:strand:- start:2944 stop:3114 length:171 start_codon:yes stop_codon:yes gene_type:complete